MTKNPDRSLTLWALDVLGRFAPPAMERGPANDAHSDLVRRYVGDPAVDQFRAQIERDRTWREEHSEDEPARRGYESDEQFFLEQQCPSDSNFR
jgi:hypothetical protein